MEELELVSCSWNSTDAVKFHVKICQSSLVQTG